MSVPKSPLPVLHHLEGGGIGFKVLKRRLVQARLILNLRFKATERFGAGAAHPARFRASFNMKHIHS